MPIDIRAGLGGGGGILRGGIYDNGVSELLPWPVPSRSLRSDQLQTTSSLRLYYDPLNPLDHTNNFYQISVIFTSYTLNGVLQWSIGTPGGTGSYVKFGIFRVESGVPYLYRVHVPTTGNTNIHKINLTDGTDSVFDIGTSLSPSTKSKLYCNDDSSLIYIADSGTTHVIDTTTNLFVKTISYNAGAGFTGQTPELMLFNGGLITTSFFNELNNANPATWLTGFTNTTDPVAIGTNYSDIENNLTNLMYTSTRGKRIVMPESLYKMAGGNSNTTPIINNRFHQISADHFITQTIPSEYSDAYEGNAYDLLYERTELENWGEGVLYNLFGVVK